MLRIDSHEVHPAQVDGPSVSAFQSTPFVYVKPTWISDASVTACAICKNKFNQLRRKHHCRCCGEVFCNKCCAEKLPLPQIGVDTAERVCVSCLPVASCITMSYSSDPGFQLRAVTGLANYCRDVPDVVVKLGGAHTLIYLSKKNFTDPTKIMTNIASGLHHLARHATLVYWLANIGTLSALGCLLSQCNHKPVGSLAISDAINALRIFAKTSDDLKIQVMNANCFSSLLSLSNHSDAGICLVAMSTICLLAECRSNHHAIVNHPDALRPMFIRVGQSQDEQVTEHVLKTLVALSCGDNETKHCIASEDAACGSVIAQVIKSEPKNLQIVAYAASLVANLAQSERDQVLLQSGLRAVLSRLAMSQPEYVRIHLMRAAANFSAYPAHASTMLLNLDAVVAALDGDKGSSKTHNHAIRCLFNMLKLRNIETIAHLCRNGVSNFLLRFSEMNDVVNQLSAILENAAPPLSM